LVFVTVWSGGYVSLVIGLGGYQEVEQLIIIGYFIFVFLNNLAGGQKILTQMWK
jgi:hypothetical protein